MAIRREDLPDDFDDLRTVDVQVPEADGESEGTCPVSMQRIREYLSYECPGGEFSGSETVVVFQLRFARTAELDDTIYWLWLFEDENGTESYVLVGSAFNESQAYYNESLAYDATFGLSPEQIIIANHFDYE